MIALTVMTGAVNAKSKLTLFTKFKLRLVLVCAAWLRFNRVPYRFVFPQGARRGDLVRPCDEMSRYVLQRDKNSALADVPHRENLTSREERVAYVEQIVREHQVKVFGFGMIFHPAHYRGPEDDPMQDAFNAEMPERLVEGIQNVIPMRRRSE